MAADASWRKRWRWLFFLLAMAALAWTVWLLWGSLSALRASLPRLKFGWLLFTLAGNTVSGYLGFEAFRTLFNRMCPGVYRRLPLGHLYFTGQLMKHLPGRVWGIAYQFASGGQVTLAEWFSVTAVYMLLATGFALWVAATVLVYMFGWAWAVFVAFVGGLVYVFAWRQRAVTMLLDLIRKIRLRVVARLCDALQPFAGGGARFKWQIWGWFVASWLAYLLAWAGYGLAWPDLTAADGVRLCAMYTLAWFVGYISVFSPSGIGVRELVFVLLAHRFPPDAVVGMAVLGRITLLAVDVTLGIAFLPFRSGLRERRRSP